MTQLDDALGGAPIQFIESQNQESVRFLGYFKPGIKYKVKLSDESNIRPEVTCCSSIACLY